MVAPDDMPQSKADAAAAKPALKGGPVAKRDTDHEPQVDDLTKTYPKALGRLAGEIDYDALADDVAGKYPKILARLAE